MSFPRYPAYKPSGVEWLPVIPTGWEISRLKQFCTVFPSNVDKKSVEGETPVKLCNYTDVYYNDSICAEMEFMDATASEEQVKKFALRAGDVIITKDSETAEDIAIAAYVPETLPGVICGYHLSMIRPRAGVSGAYVKRIFDSIYAKSLFAVRANGLTRVGLSQYAVDNVELPLPPSHEQLAIATFLDHETVKIDALIAEQQRLIELLQEKRQAVISHAVTKGLNPDAPMKDSGVEWLGEVPEHWSILPVWMLFFLGRGRVISHEDIAISPGDYPVYSSQTERDGEMGKIDTFDFEGDYLTWTTDGANAGSVFQRSGRFNCTNVCGTLRAKSSTRVLLDFALQSLRLATSAFVRMDINPKLMNNVMASIKIPIPPVLEQQEIARHIRQKTERFKPLETSIALQLSLLKERRSALISAAVTGQIDARGLVPEASAA